MSSAFPEVIAPTRTILLKSRTGQQRLKVEMETQSLADVRAFIAQITRETTAEQEAIGNPPTLLEVDGATGKAVEDVDKKTVVIYGTILAQAAMREVEQALREMILRSTTPRTGRLADTTSTWQWVYVPKGGHAQAVTSSTTLPTFGVGDVLALRPMLVPYATLTNRNVARAGRIVVSGRRGKSAPASKQNRGFLFHAAESLRRRSAFAQFRVRVVFSVRHMVPGELMTRTSGTGMIVISPRARRVKV